MSLHTVSCKAASLFQINTAASGEANGAHDDVPCMKAATSDMAHARAGQCCTHHAVLGNLASMHNIPRNGTVKSPSLRPPGRLGNGAPSEQVWTSNPENPFA